MYFSHLIFVFVLYSATVDGASLGNYDTYLAPNGHLMVYQPETWRNARLKCFAEGAILASPENFELYTAMINAMNANTPIPYEYVFTGIHNTFSNLYFNSLEGTPLEQLAAYGEHEIRSDNEDSCLKMNKNGYLYNSKCTEKLPFICYKKKTMIRDVIRNPMTNLDCGSSTDGYSLSSETSSCYKFHKEYVYWYQAFAACAKEDAHLAIINSQEESQVLKNIFENHQDGRETNEKAVFTDVVHVGFVNWGKEGGLWMTIDGQTIESAGFAVWGGIKEPNNSTNQFCGGMYIDGRLDDVNCGNGDPGHKYRSFICEKKPEIRTDPTWILSSDTRWRQCAPHLAIVNSQEESQVLKDLFLKNQDGRDTKKAVDPHVAHIGFVDWGKEGGLWMTIDGQTIESAGFAKWSTKFGQEPNNSTNQFCGGLYDDGNFDDVNCADGDPMKKYRSFICEKKPVIKTELIKSDNINFRQNP